MKSVKEAKREIDGFIDELKSLKSDIESVIEEKEERRRDRIKKSKRVRIRKLKRNYKTENISGKKLLLSTSSYLKK